MNLPDPIEAVSELEKAYSLPDGFYENLQDEDDWSFIIKLNSLVEAAISDLIVEALADKKLDKFIRKLNLQGDKGKLGVIKALNLLDDEYQSFVRRLAELRNTFAHNISYVSLDLQKYAIDTNQVQSWSKSFSLGVNEIEFDERKLDNAEYMRENPKKFIWTTGLICLATIRVRQLQQAEIHSLKEEKLYKEGQLAGIKKLLARLGIDEEDLVDK
ncbi:MAG: hypothetical protein IT314_04955 [Anaerolineales bacterium]|nr:hypothetical protein [Anaerolineales bacterium]